MFIPNSISNNVDFFCIPIINRILVFNRCFPGLLIVCFLNGSICWCLPFLNPLPLVSLCLFDPWNLETLISCLLHYLIPPWLLSWFRGSLIACFHCPCPLAFLIIWFMDSSNLRLHWFFGQFTSWNNWFLASVFCWCLRLRDSLIP